MPINLPDIETGMDAFLKQMQLGRQNKLLDAKTQQAQAKANQANMIANLLGGGMPSGSGQPGGGQPGGGGSGAPNLNGMSANKALLLAGALGLPTQVVEGNLITPFGTFKTGESKQEARLGEAGAQATGQTLKNINQAALENVPLEYSYKELEKIMENPKYKNVAGTMEGKFIGSQPMGIPLGAMLQKALPSTFSKEDADLFSTANTHLGNIVVNVAQKFKGPFRNMVSGIINTMKPTMGDSPQIQKSKIKALQKLSKIGDDMNDSINKYINEDKMDSTSAIMKASKELTAKLSNMDAPESAKNKPEQSSPSNKITQEHITAENIMSTAKQLNKSVPEVIEELEKRGFKIPEGPME